MKQTSRLAVLALSVAVISGCTATTDVLKPVTPPPQGGTHFVKVEWIAPPAPEVTPSSARICLAQKTETPPIVNGVLDDPCWKSAPVLTNLTLLDAEGTPADVQTRAQFAFTADTLYVAFTCAEPAMAGLIAKCATSGSQAIWYDDCVELWLDVNYDRRHSYHFLVNPLATVCEIREWNNEVEDVSADQSGPRKVLQGGETVQNSGCLAKVARGTDGWTVELAIPARSLGAKTIIRGSVYGLNVARTRRSGGGCWLSSWAGVFTSPISRFGTLQLSKSNFDSEVISQGALAEGDSSFTVQVKNTSDAAGRIRLEVRAASGTQTKEHVRVALSPGESKRVSVPYRLHGIGGRYAIEFDAFDEGTNEQLLSRRYEGIVPGALNLKLTRSELYLGEKNDVEGFLVVNLGDAGLAASSLSFQVATARGRIVAADTVDHLQPRAAVKLNVAELKEEGTYTLRVRLFDGDKHCVAEKQALFSLAESPF